MFELQDLWAKARTCAKAASGAGFSAPTRMTRGAVRCLRALTIRGSAFASRRTRVALRSAGLAIGAA
jgi:hypothetical protein